MQSSLKAAVRLLRTRIAALRNIRGSVVALGAAVVLVAIGVLVAATAVYLHPLGQRVISFETTDAASITTGEDVRAAGVTVGKVSGMTIEPNAVRVDLNIDRSTFVGSDSTIDVRMLTPVGGYAVTLISAGEIPLPSHGVIPVDRVQVPYSIADVLQAVPHVTDNVKGGTIDANIDQIASALQHNNTSIKSIIDGMNSIATVMDQQRNQVHKIMDVSAEYLGTFNRSRDIVFELERQVDIVISTYDNAMAGFNETWERLGDILFRLLPVLKFYVEHKDELRTAVEKARSSITALQQDLGPALDNMKGLQQRLRAWLGPQGLKTIGGGTLLASDVCVPTPGRTC
ncbi:MAG: MCE family protein [Nocardia sp.]|nr:MCE family protein [Nocardia sp.]